MKMSINMRTSHLGIRQRSLGLFKIHASLDELLRDTWILRDKITSRFYYELCRMYSSRTTLKYSSIVDLVTLSSEPDSKAYIRNKRSSSKISSVAERRDDDIIFFWKADLPEK